MRRHQHATVATLQRPLRGGALRGRRVDAPDAPTIRVNHGTESVRQGADRIPTVTLERRLRDPAVLRDAHTERGLRQHLTDELLDDLDRAVPLHRAGLREPGLLHIRLERDTRDRDPLMPEQVATGVALD